MSARHAIALFAVALSTTSCNQYDMFRLSGYTQESFSNRADIIFVVDNSASMIEEAAALASNFSTFIRDLTEEEDDSADGGIPSAVETYIAYVQNRGSFVNYQLSITTTDAETDYGRLYGAVPVVSKGDDDVAETFIQNLMCDATCVPQASDLPNVNHTCGDPLGDSNVGQQYLNCECGQNEWVGNCASTGAEEPLEALFMSMCRAVPNPPERCFDPVNQFREADILSNDGMLRDRGTVIPVIITDEGDQSRRFPSAEPDAEIYIDLFNRFGKRITPVVIGPVFDDEIADFKCPTGAANIGALRFRSLVDYYDGLLINIADPDNGCAETDFSVALDQLGQLLKSLQETFPLQSVPDIDTLLVFVEGVRVAQSDESIVDGSPAYTDGWSYDDANNAIEFHGSARPEPNADVQIYYQPLDGMPRELPF